MPHHVHQLMPLLTSFFFSACPLSCLELPNRQGNSVIRVVSVGDESVVLQPFLITSTAIVEIHVHLPTCRCVASDPQADTTGFVDSKARTPILQSCVSAWLAVSRSGTRCRDILFCPSLATPWLIFSHSRYLDSSFCSASSHSLLPHSHPDTHCHLSLHASCAQNLFSQCEIAGSM